MSYNIIKNKLGYYEVSPKPDSDFLENYYHNQYYQKGIGGSLNYTEEEIANIEYKQSELYQLLEPLFHVSKKSMCDIGCGEGWNLKFYKERGWQVTGIDISDFGILQKNPDLLDNFTKTNLVDGLSNLEIQGKLFDVIILMNVLEHVLDPVLLIESIKKILAKDGVLVIQVPNDYSLLQVGALNQGFVNESYWIQPPDHLNYFNKNALVELLHESGFACKDSFANFPVEFFLFNDLTNYQANKSIGKTVHNARITIENLISSLPFEEAMNLYRSFAVAGIGRNITGIFKKNE